MLDAGWGCEISLLWPLWHSESDGTCMCKCKQATGDTSVVILLVDAQLKAANADLQLSFLEVRVNERRHTAEGVAPGAL